MSGDDVTARILAAAEKIRTAGPGSPRLARDPVNLPAIRNWTDAIGDAVDYRLVAACVQEVSDSRSFDLIEALAVAVANTLVARFPGARARVRVRKPDVKVDAPRVCVRLNKAKRFGNNFRHVAPFFG